MRATIGPTAAAADRLGIRASSFLRGGTRPDERVRAVIGFAELGELRLAHREPGQIRHLRQARHEIALDRVPILVLGKGTLEPAQPLEPRLERGLAFAAPGVPALEVRQDGDEAIDRVDGRIVQSDRRRGFRVRAQQAPEVEGVDGVRLRRAPS